MKKVLAEIKSLEQKIAASDYKKYKKEHPATKKTPNDPMFKVTLLERARHARF